MSSTSYEGSAEATAVGEGESPGPAAPPEKAANRSYNLPDTPLVTIKASKAWSALNLKELWAYRELLFFLIWRDIKVRYKQTFLGGLWALMQPLVMMLIFTFFFGKLARMPTDGIPSGLFYYSGLSLWAFFSNAVANGANSLLGNTNLITKIYFPRLIIPSAAVLAGVVDFAIASVLLIPLLAYYGFGVTWRMFFLVPLSILITTLALGVGVLFSALNAKYRDVRHALPFVLQVWMFISPVIYPSSLLPPQWRWLLALNPLTGIIESYRSALFGQAINWWNISYSVVFAFAILFLSAYTFRRMERSFAEVI